jgi:GntR family transcriptional regulator, transcriptional repressor for pyruvate dehydrogenase complex
MEAVKIDRQKLSDRVALQIEQWITAGHVRPGAKLPSVRELCQLFNVGRTAVRDAITTLKGKGLVEVRHGNGTFVRQSDCSRVFQGVSLVRKEDIHKLFAVRKILEAGTAELAAVHRNTDHLYHMKKALERLAQADSCDGWRADLHFHLAIAEATQNEHLVQLMQTVSSAIRKGIMDCHRIILADAEQERVIFHQHVAVFEAIRDAKPEQARQAMVEHLAHVEALLNGTL